MKKVLWICLIGAIIAASCRDKLLPRRCARVARWIPGTPLATYTGTTPFLPTQAGGLTNGNYLFSDRTFTFANTPTATLGPLNEPLIGSEYVRTFNSDKNSTTVNYAVTLSMKATLWITVDDRFSNDQGVADTITRDFAAAGTFKDTGIDLFAGGDSNRRLSIYAANVDPGTYNFKHQGSSSNNSYLLGAVNADPSYNPPPAVIVPDHYFARPTFPLAAIINATVTDKDPLEGTPGTLSYAWSFVSGPAAVSFADATVEDPTAIFPQPGEYVLKLVVSDGTKTGKTR